MVYSLVVPQYPYLISLCSLVGCVWPEALANQLPCATNVLGGLSKVVKDPHIDYLTDYLYPLASYDCVG